MFSALKITKKIVATPREYFAIAPMVDFTDRHFRFFMRLLSKKCFLYTEMLNEHAIIYAKNGRDRLLSFD